MTVDEILWNYIGGNSPTSSLNGGFNESALGSLNPKISRISVAAPEKVDRFRNKIEKKLK